MTFAEARTTLMRLKKVPMCKMDRRDRVKMFEATEVIKKHIGARGLIEILQASTQ